MERPDAPGAGGPAETVVGFVNTREDTSGRIERFGSASDFADWARENGLLTEGIVSESEATAARELRSSLLTVMLAHSDHPGTAPEQVEDAEAQLAHAAELYPVKITLSVAGSSLESQGRGAAGVFGSVLAAANEVVQRGGWARIKACCSHPCEHGFVDRTKNGARRYCSSACASRAASRAMRGRQRKNPEQPTA
ncbi:CGNR zinc finger domain-containing protein [Streptomyces tauricus]|uniref:CGNR zinc finger domain-containing protein n=1 Tax=Streptomyces tauricus TaxID=68274 RepID=A0ABZ1JSS9_9ACTN|nr:CGNR zinc finger domain-containing protein [Streptomyces tauricus]